LDKLQNSPPNGIHYLIEFFGCEAAHLDSVVFWKRLLSQAIKDSDVMIINKRFYKFSPHGLTGYLLLSASHISIHTWPEHCYAACDVFSCGAEDETNKIVGYIKSTLHYKKAKVKKLKRGFRVNTRLV
jgi:S-adenosylmethionine decarboxylase